MADPIEFGDVEALLVSVLREALADGTPVATRAPATNVPQYVRLSRVGGPARAIFMDAPMVLIECWALKAPDASRLSARARKIVLALNGKRVGQAAISEMKETGGPSYFDDPENINYHRYQFVVQFGVRWYPA